MLDLIDGKIIMEQRDDDCGVYSTTAIIIDENHFSDKKISTEPKETSENKCQQEPTQDLNTKKEISIQSTLVSPIIEAQKVTFLEDGNNMIDESLTLDEDTIISSTVTSSAKGNAYMKAEAPEDEDNDATLLSRRYDISITYDNYYRTPRFWLFGYDENGTPLRPEAIFQDIMTDYAHRTVTLDPHPHVSRPHASIHPCQHGATMKRILDELANGGNVPTVDQYIFIFLKFIQSVVPTIEYDYTMDVRVGVGARS